MNNNNKIGAAALQDTWNTTSSASLKVGLQDLRERQRETEEKPDQVNQPLSQLTTTYQRLYSTALFGHLAGQ